MVWAIAIVLGLLWALALSSAASLSGYVHVLLAAALILVGYGIVRRYRERRV